MCVINSSEYNQLCFDLGIGLGLALSSKPRPSCLICDFWLTVLSVAPLLQDVVCLSVVCLSVTFCIQAKRLDRFA